MRKQHLLGLMSIVMLTSACGKSMSLTAKAPVVAPTSKQQVEQAVNKDVAVLDGKLLPFSGYDMSMLQKDLLFVDASNTSVNGLQGISAIGSPEFLVNGESNKQGFVKQSNLVFRAIKNIPPVAAAMQTITEFKIVLRDVRFYNDGTLSAEDALKNQVLCLVDADPSKVKCAGGKLDVSGDKNINPFWKQVQLSSYEIAPKTAFKDIYDIKGDEKIYQYVGLPVAATSDIDALAAASTQKSAVKSTTATVVTAPASKSPGVTLEIDLQKAFAVADKDLAQWIIDNSTVYDSTGTYRKFRFELGNNLYAASGELVLSYTTAKTAPAEVAGTPVNGDTDVSKDTDYATGIKLDDSTISGAKFHESIADSAFSFDTATDGSTVKLSDTSEVKLKGLADSLVKYQDSIIDIRVISNMDVGTDKVASKNAADNRAVSIKRALGGLLVKSDIDTKGQVSTKKSTCAAVGVCPGDRSLIIEISLGKELASDKAAAIQTELDGLLKDLNAGSAPVAAAVAVTQAADAVPATAK